MIGTLQKKSATAPAPKESKKRMIPQKKTLDLYDEILASCQALFEKKNKDYGSSWLILRMEAFTDLLMIKTRLATTLEPTKEQADREELRNEVVGILNYAIMALIKAKGSLPAQPSVEELIRSYQEVASDTRALLAKKNSKYNEIWREMRIASIIDIIHMKLIRIREIERNEGATLVSEGVDAGYQDIINYAVFLLILLKEEEQKRTGRAPS